MRRSNVEYPLHDWWAANISGSRGLFEVFGGRPANLDAAVCNAIRFDPFPSSAFLEIELADFPDEPPPRWVSNEYDTVALKIQMTGCHDLSASGTLEPCSITITPSTEGNYTVLASDNFNFSFAAKYSLISTMRAIKSSRTNGQFEIG
ncbi:Imm50 family immunity protein [Propionibacterium australiense]|uniref:Imm50 family immunity protein n=1 Tax=Propionibacterium australiense TaxID=119981 RepID=UPI000F822094|nr:Imm50 family immunity protein [Propionibacterium australiense]